MVVLVAALGACSGGSGEGGGGREASATTAGGDIAPTAGGGEYCTLARSYAKAFERFGQPGTSADQRAYYQQASADIRRAVEVAPSEMKADVETVAGVLQTLVTALEGINYDFTRVSSLPPDLIARLMNQQFTAAATRVANHGRDTCGIA